MAFVLKDRVRETSDTNGTGAIHVTGVVTGGYQTFTSVLSNGDTTLCLCRNDAGQWQTFLGTWVSATQSLTRTTAYEGSSGAGVNVNFSGESQEVWIDYPAQWYHTPRFETVRVGDNLANYWSAAGSAAAGELTFTAAGTDTDIGWLFAAKGDGQVRARRILAQAVSLTPAAGVLPAIAGSITNAISGTITSGVASVARWQIVADTAAATGATGSNVYYMNGLNLFGGTGMTGGRIGFNVSHVLANGNTSNSSGSTSFFHTGIQSQTSAAFRDGGIPNDHSGMLYAYFGSSELRPGGKYFNAVSTAEFNVAIERYASANWKYGLNIVTSTTDAEEAVIEEGSIIVGAKKANATNSIGFRAGIIFGGVTSYWGIPAHGSLMEANATTVSGGSPPAMTAAYGMDVSLVSFGGALFRSSGYTVDGSYNVGTNAVNAGVTLLARDGVQAKTAVVAGVTVLDGGTFTSIPTFTIAAPPGSGSTATGTVATMGMRIIRNINTAGSGYAVDDILTVSGGTGTAATIRVTEVTVTGGITSAVVETAGSYSVLPASPFAVTSGAAEFQAGYKILTCTVGGGGSNYPQFPPPLITVDTAAMIRRSKLIPTMTASNAALLLASNYANYMTLTGAASGGTFDASAPFFQAAGADTHIDAKVLGKGTNGRLNSLKLYIGPTTNRASVQDSTRAFFQTGGAYTTTAAPGFRVGGDYSGTVTSGQAIFHQFAIDSDTVDPTTSSGPDGALGLYIGHTVSAGAKGGRTAIYSLLNIAGAITADATGAGSFFVGGGFRADAAANAGGTSGLGNGLGRLFAGNRVAVLKSGATYWDSLIGDEITVGAQTGSSVYYKNGLQIVLGFDDAVAGTGGFDCGLVFGQTIDDASPGWNFGISFGHALGWWPMNAAGTLIGTVPSTGGLGPAYAAAYGVDFNSVTFSTAAIRTPGFLVDGSGTATTTGQKLAMRVVTAAGAVTVSATDDVVVVNKTVGAATTANLPAGVTGRRYTIKDGKGDAAANNITITPAAGTIDGAATLVIAANYGKATLIYNGTEWNQTA